MNNPFVKRAERRPVGALIQTLLGSLAGTVAGDQYNKQVLLGTGTPRSELARMSMGGVGGALLGNPYTRRFIGNQVAPYETVRVKSRGGFQRPRPGDFDLKETLPSRRLSVPAATAAATLPAGAFMFLPSLSDAGAAARETGSQIVNDYATDSLPDENFTGYLARKGMEGIPDRWYDKAINSYVDMTKETAGQALEMAKDVGKDMKPVLSNVTTEMGKGLVPVGTGVAAGGLMGNLVARGLTDRNSKRETAEDERAWDKRNRLINMASLLGATVGGLGGYKLYEHNLQNV